MGSVTCRSSPHLRIELIQQNRISTAEEENMSKQANLEAQVTFGEAVGSGNLEAIRDVVSPTCVDHDPAPGQAPGPEGFIHFFTGLRTAFPDLKVAVEHLVQDDDNVAFAYTMTGTHQGDLFGVPGTGKKVKVRGMQIGRFEGGKLVERWGSTDQLGILQQVGAFPA
jgi:steroid delta-isomerase-like uncharacterized protein